MAPLGVDPAALDAAGTEVVTAAEGLAAVMATLTSVLSGCAGMAGDDPAGAALGRSYDRAAAKLIEAMVATRNGLGSLGAGVRMSAHNYALAEAMSNIGGGGTPLAPPSPPGLVSAGPAPSAVGSSDDAPAGWGWVAPYIGMIWPNGDSAKLRTAAAAWNAAGTQFGIGEILGTGTPMGVIRAQQIPEGAAIDRAFADAYSSTTGVVQQCQQVATQLNGYAAKIDKVHAAILDLLSRICDPLTGVKEVWDILTDQDEDEIKKIAEDIRTVIDNFKAEVAALEAEIAAALAEATTIASTMAHYAAKQWDQFLHTTAVGHFVDLVGHGTKEFASEAGGFIKGLYDISQVRLVLDPMGYFHDINSTALGAAPLVGLGPDGGPGVLQSWKTLGKDVSHWDQWATDPAGALGRTVFDGLTLALPGGPLSKLGTKSRTALDALKDLKAPPLPKLPDPPAVKPPEVAKPPAAPGVKPPEPGSPAPPPKPAPAPAGAPLPHSPTEPKPPVGETPKPAAGAPNSAGKPAVAVPGEAPHAPHGPVSGHAPTAAAPPGAAAPHLPSAPHLPTAPSLPSAPHLPSAPSLPTGGGAPGEALPHGGMPHGGEPGEHGPGDGKSPADGAPHQPGDGINPLPTSALDLDDHSALGDYTGLGYRDLNNALRTDVLDASQQARVDAVTRALEKLPPYEGPVIRGTNVPADVLDRYVPGQVITEPAFTSTTTLRAVAEGPAFAGNAEFRIFSTTGRDVSSFSTYPGEQEILFPPGTKFYVVSKTVDPQTGRTIIEMIER